MISIYFAPMEGITGHIYRNLYQSCFYNIDKYFTPFIVGNRKAGMKARELRDVLPENNPDINIVPQILTADATEFVNTAKRLHVLGYSEVNLNLGCPSGTVVSKGRGSGFLAFPDKLDAFFEEVFEKTDVRVSVKTRLGMDDVSEFDGLLSIYCKYPLTELIIHPRSRKELYSGHVHLDMFSLAVERCPFPVCYNGDIFRVEDYRQIRNRFPQVSRIMIGRGLLANPFLVEQIRAAEEAQFMMVEGGSKELQKTSKEFLQEFYDRLYDGYRQELSGDKDVLFKLKELWNYQIWMFDDDGKHIKAIRKAKTKTEYDLAVRGLFRECELLEDTGMFYRAR